MAQMGRKWVFLFAGFTFALVFVLALKAGAVGDLEFSDILSLRLPRAVLASRPFLPILCVSLILWGFLREQPWARWWELPWEPLEWFQD